MMAGMAKAALPVAATRLLAYIDKLHAGCPVAQLPSCPVAQLPSCLVAQLPSCLVA